MRMPFAIAAMLFVASAAPAADGGYLRVMSCTGPDAAMELYLKEINLEGAETAARLDGFYALDLSGALKGKHLEPVHVSASRDGKFIIVDQYTRGLPPTKIPRAGGTVNFDNRFGTRAKCSAFGAE